MPISKIAAQQLPGYLWDNIKKTVNFVYKPVKWTAQKAYKWSQTPGEIGGKALSNTAKGLAWSGEKLWNNPKWAVPGVVGAGVLVYNTPKTLSNYITHSDPRYDLTQTDGWSGIQMRKQADWANNLETIGKGIGAVIAAGKGISLAHNFVTGIVGNFEQKKVIEKLLNIDPIIKNADRQQVMSFFKTICNMAPSISTDENMVKDLLHNFIKFGRIDMQSLKLLVDAEKTYKDSSTPLWAKVK